MASGTCNLTLTPGSLEEMKEGVMETVTMALSCDTLASYLVNISSTNTGVARIDGQSQLLLESKAVSNFTVEAVEFGRSTLQFATRILQGPSLDIEGYDVSVVREGTVLDIIFIAVLACIILIYNFSFGCKIHLTLAIQIGKRPIGPAVGFVCQFLIMPLLAFGFGQAVGLDDIYGMGLLAVGCCPGGGGSNVFAYMLSADLELSIMMTFMSTILAIGMTPLWIWTLGRFYTEGNPRIEIPVTNVFTSLAAVIIPVGLGVALNHYNTRYGTKVAQLLKPFTGLVGFAFISLGTATYFYALQRATWDMFVSCILLSFSGYTIAFIIGMLIVKDKKQAVTISLETGFQNLALAILMLGISLPSPESEMAGTMPIIYTFMGSPFPVTVFLVMIIHRYVTTGQCTAPNSDTSFEISQENMEIEKPQEQTNIITTNFNQRENGGYQNESFNF